MPRKNAKVTPKQSTPLWAQRFDILANAAGKVPVPVGFFNRVNDRLKWPQGGESARVRATLIEETAPLMAFLPGCSDPACDSPSWHACALCFRPFCSHHVSQFLFGQLPELPHGVRLCAECAPAAAHWRDLLDLRLGSECRAELGRRAKLPARSAAIGKVMEKRLSRRDFKAAHNTPMPKSAEFYAALKSKAKRRVLGVGKNKPVRHAR
jgi:hypothetical protein